MYTVFAILIIITSVLLVLIVLVQNPKGGGLSSSFGGGAGNQIMGAKKTTDFLEKATWTLAIALIVLFCQISLGGWTSSNYAALACPDFPTCQGTWWPKMNFFEGFILWRGLGIDYEGGTLDGAARTAIHMAHRIGAVITTIVIAYVGLRNIFTNTRSLKLTGTIVLILLTIQILLGIANVKLSLPIFTAVAHNGVAALLLLSLVTLLYQCMDHRK